MPAETAKAVHLYEAVARSLAEQISDATYPPGSLLPSETEVMELFDVSRPTARAAFAELRTMGLIRSQRGKGSYVREAAERVTVDQGITRKGKRFTAYDAQFTEAEAVQSITTHITAPEAAFLGYADEAAFAATRLLLDPATSLYATHRTLIPFRVAADHQDLTERPTAAPAEIYAILTAGGHTLTWHEYVSARPATATDRATLRLTDAPWLLVSQRVSLGADDAPLLLETLTTSATRARLAYRVTADRAPARKASV